MLRQVFTYVPSFIAGACAVTVVKLVDAERKLSQLQQSSSSIQPPRGQLELSGHREYRPFFATGHTVFSFGPASSFNFLCGVPSTRKRGTTALFLWRTLSPQHTFAHQTLSKSQTVPYYSTFTPHGDEFVAYANPDNKRSTWQLKFSPSRHAQAPQYQSLTKWLQEEVSLTESSLMNTIVVFGPGASYFARTTNSCTWHDLPPRLERIILEEKAIYNDNSKNSNSKIDANTDSSAGSDVDSSPDNITKTVGRPAWIPRIVALGANDSYIGIWEKGRCVTSLYPTNRLVSTFSDISSSKIHDYENIVLSPHDSGKFFSATKQGHLDWSIGIGHRDRFEILKFAAVADYYMQMRAKRDGSSFTLRSNFMQKDVTLSISPDTDWTVEKLCTHLTPSRWQLLWEMF